MTLLTGLAWQKHWLAHPQKTTSLDESRFIETEIYQTPEQAHLTEDTPSLIPKPQSEHTLSTQPLSGKMSPTQTPLTEEQNQTTAGPKISENHGPISVFAPPPVIPPYLQDRELQAHVVIDFYINTQGVASPRLAGSSGNDELDAIALTAVKKWVFRPAEAGGKPIDAKIRLRIVFVVQ
jgi:TonB family protein